MRTYSKKHYGEGAAATDCTASLENVESNIDAHKWSVSEVVHLADDGSSHAETAISIFRRSHATDASGRQHELTLVSAIKVLSAEQSEKPRHKIAVVVLPHVIEMYLVTIEPWSGTPLLCV